jgi:serine/threonine-protein kinase
MSPEQAQAKPADARSDIFSFGLVLYELLSGRRAFDGESAIEVMAAILRDEPAPLDAPAKLVEIE